MSIVFDTELIRKVYAAFPERLELIRKTIKRPLTLSEKILYVHLADLSGVRDFKRGEDYMNFNPDRVAMQDATAQMALLQFMNAGRPRTSVPATVHCDHLIVAGNGAVADIKAAENSNKEVYDFLRTASAKFGITYWKPGAGIIHQVLLENYAFPGGMIIGTDSHTPNAGGLGMIAIGAGGADAVDVMSGMPFELRMPRLIGVRLTGRMSGWASPKDVILKLAGMLTVKGATNAIIEYFGDGATSISATGKATICNMGAEVGATTSLFPFDKKMSDYLYATSRKIVADSAQDIAAHLQPDDKVLKRPADFYDQYIEIDLSSLEPYINGPFSPDIAHPLSEFAGFVKENGFPEKVETGLIGSCTNSSYEDLSRAAFVARQAVKSDIEIRTELLVNPGSEQVRSTAERDGILKDLGSAGAVIMANACGPCIGQWKRKGINPDAPNSIVTSFNRNFAGRNDGNARTHAFVASPEITMALSVAGNLCFNPLTDSLINRQGEEIRLEPPAGTEFPGRGFLRGRSGYIIPPADGSSVTVRIIPGSERLQVLQPFRAWRGIYTSGMRLLIKTKGKCTTDHISMAGPWLRYRGHLEKISENLLMGATNSFNDKVNLVLNPLDGSYDKVSAVAGVYKKRGIYSVIVAEENYGEGSSREHAAMESRFLNVRVIVAKSFARIHETNLKKQGLLALTFTEKADYDRIREDDIISVEKIERFSPGKPLAIRLYHRDGTEESFNVNHSYNDIQIGWFKAGSALNSLKPDDSVKISDRNNAGFFH